VAVPSSPVFEISALVERLGGDRRLARELITIFRADAPGAMRRIKQAGAKRNMEALGQAAHALKGALATIGAGPARETAARLEAAARGGDTTVARQLVATLSADMALLDRKLTVKKKK
jgi:HPt (histidine-containing phosphotransfer) domain-containing protein